ncbi:hypothetical protein QQF64_024932 [Cirrhinus molitorella]|uniref:Ig-like domain-containing protein n=1 Tax=Cirrhinus molitorella TaxID=172907 RepID=A0ABR3NMV1_9TELE
MVTVSSAQSSPPKSIFPMSQCTPGSDGFLTVGCLARGFSPADSLTFKWKGPDDKELSDFVQYPAFGPDGDYTKISHMRVKKSEWDAKKPYTCEATNSQGTVSAPLVPPSPPPDQRATVYLTVPTKTELDNGTATFMCVARRFSPKNYAFKWFQDGRDVTYAIDKFDKSEKNGSVTEYSATSILQITAEQWKPESKVKCKFEHKAGNEEKEVDYADCGEVATDIGLEPDIVAPSLEDMLKNRVGTLKCKASAEAPGFTKITIKANENVIAKNPSGEDFHNKRNVELDAPIGYEEWSNGTVFTCTIEHKGLAAPKEKTFRRENEFSVWIERSLFEDFDTDDSGIANTAVTFVFLFLITLFYSIGATFVKVK